MMQEILLYLVGGILIISAVFSLAAAIGILRLPDLYTRMHAASKAGTLGSGLALLAIAIFSLEGSVVLRAVAGFVFFLADGTSCITLVGACCLCCRIQT